jgi:hypothetical protein
MSVSMLIVDDESDVGELFRERNRHETRQGTRLFSLTSVFGPSLRTIAKGAL